MRVEFIAEVCHEVNKVYCESIGDYSQPSWNEAPFWQKQSAIDGVEFNIRNPDVLPEETHFNWMEHKIKDGWIYGPVKDANNRTHPCLVPYDQLPEQQKTKDKLFQTVVNLLK